MPICIHCTAPVPYLYTVYQSAHNVRLEQCPTCLQFADLYVEHDALILVLDLILLKRGVYRHLLFNRGAPPRKAGAAPMHNASHETIDGAKGNAVNVQFEKDEWEREKMRRSLIARLGCALVTVDAFIRWSRLHPAAAIFPATRESPWTQEATIAFSPVWLGCFIETIAFHAGITLSSFLVLEGLKRCSSWSKRSSSKPPHESTTSSVREQLRYSHIPICLLYSSLTKFFLLFLLSIWGTASPTASADLVVSTPRYKHTITFDSPTLQLAWGVLDDDKLDREWVVRNVLGGMAAGFGLRVVLDCHPFFTTLIVLVGWVCKTVVANIANSWIGKDKMVGEAWLAYSIP
ncbi:Arv1-domain-containing protein [Stereum hirsutum FP-91666 SS1]|uniref:Arv1-domain-containing protein n=1 Tax=Stereum hirsutum (strain FP-91666) TaxID=721885 RepID=UPI000440ACD6|nr:Arv1-domain-containing protein [Stereum hirsutum FP-91666 SS1]EIM90941.1 Arv1-domain-containing protein [Stereum hirsutum FP-91666 SS1]